MLAEEKTAAYVIGAVTSSPGVLASALGWVDSVHSLLALVALVVGLAAGILFLWFSKIMRDREDERQRAEDERVREEERRDAERRKEEARREETMREEQQKTRELLQKAILQHEYLSRQLAEVSADVRRAHERLDVGREKFQKVEVDIATLRARLSGHRSGRSGDTFG